MGVGGREVLTGMPMRWDRWSRYSDRKVTLTKDAERSPIRLSDEPLGLEKIVLMGHSSGCDAMMNYLSTPSHPTTSDPTSMGRSCKALRALANT